MCGRYTVRRISLAYYGLAEMPPDLPFEEFTERPHFNIAPSQPAPIIRIDSKGQRVARLVRWGLIPHWMKDKPKSQPINARCENAATTAMFRQAMERRRCLVPADGFYEWQGAKPPKQPYFVHMKNDAPFAFAGLWERWKPDEAAEPIDTFTILTTSPNDLMRPIHNRMPVILDQGDYDRWLDRTIGAGGVADLLKPFDAERMEAYAVTTAVNTPRNDERNLIEPLR